MEVFALQWRTPVLLCVEFDTLFALVPRTMFVNVKCVCANPEPSFANICLNL